jgi:hypothetical protein
VSAPTTLIARSICAATFGGSKMSFDPARVLFVQEPSVPEQYRPPGRLQD